MDKRKVSLIIGVFGILLLAGFLISMNSPNTENKVNEGINYNSKVVVAKNGEKVAESSNVLYNTGAELVKEIPTPVDLEEFEPFQLVSEFFKALPKTLNISPWILYGGFGFAVLLIMSLLLFLLETADEYRKLRKKQ